MLERLSENFVYSNWQRVDDRHSAVRFCTSWATLPENVEQLIAAIEKS
jgi:threonine aldolase